MGYTFIPNNRVLAIDEAAINIDTGSAVTGYPKVNLTDPCHWLTARFTPSASTVLLRFTFGTAPDGAVDNNYRVNSFGLVNHNLDGATIALYYGTTTTFSSAIQVSGSEIDLANCDHAFLLYKFDTDATSFPSGGATAANYWWLEITSAPTPVEIGNVVWGYAIDLGDPLRPENFTSVPWKDPINTLAGYQIVTGPSEPIDTKVVTFADPTYTDKDYVWNKLRNTSYDYPDYITVWRMWRHLYESSMGESINTAVGPAGGQVPILYHEGSSKGLTTSGRPAFYGFCRPQIRRNEARQASVIVMSITDANPKSPDTQPPDLNTWYNSTLTALSATATGTASLGFVGPV